MKPFVLLATRFDDAIAAAEYEQFRHHAGLAPEQLRRIRLEAAPLPSIDLDEVSGIIIGGSPFTTSDPADTKTAVQVRVEADLAGLLTRVMERDLPLLGACYGVGTLAIHEGAVVDTTYGETAGPVEIRLTDAGREDPLIRASGLPERFLGIVGHKEAVRTLPAHATLLATGEDCPVQAFRFGTRQYATQFHPELDAEGLGQRLRVYRDSGYIDPSEIDPLLHRMEAVDVTAPPRLLRGFVELFAR